MLALVGTVMSRSSSGNVLLRDRDGVLGTHRVAYPTERTLVSVDRRPSHVDSLRILWWMNEEVVR